MLTAEQVMSLKEDFCGLEFEIKNTYSDDFGWKKSVIIYSDGVWASGREKIICFCEGMLYGEEGFCGPMGDYSSHDDAISYLSESNKWMLNVGVYDVSLEDIRDKIFEVFYSDINFKGIQTYLSNCKKDIFIEFLLLHHFFPFGSKMPNFATKRIISNFKKMQSIEWNDRRKNNYANIIEIDSEYHIIQRLFLECVGLNPFNICDNMKLEKSLFSYRSKEYRKSLVNYIRQFIPSHWLGYYDELAKNWWEKRNYDFLDFMQRYCDMTSQNATDFIQRIQ